MKLSSNTPIIGVPMCIKMSEGQNIHWVGDKYLRALTEVAGAYPLSFPALGEIIELDRLLDRLDGLMFTGSASNVAVHHYKGDPDRPESPQDPGRDGITLPLLRRAIEREMPILCICRGMQELNVALGGTLHTQIHTKPDHLDHRAPENVPFEDKYSPRHEVQFTPGGKFATLLGKEKTRINSLHWQAMENLSPKLVVEGRAPDGVIEAVSIKDYNNFGLATQWHPEFRAAENPDSTKLFRAFGEACRLYAGEKSASRQAAE